MHACTLARAASGRRHQAATPTPTLTGATPSAKPPPEQAAGDAPLSVELEERKKEQDRLFDAYTKATQDLASHNDAHNFSGACSDCTSLSQYEAPSKRLTDAITTSLEAYRASLKTSSEQDVRPKETIEYSVFTPPTDGVAPKPLAPPPPPEQAVCEADATVNAAQSEVPVRASSFALRAEAPAFVPETEAEAEAAAEASRAFVTHVFARVLRAAKVRYQRNARGQRRKKQRRKERREAAMVTKVAAARRAADAVAATTIATAAPSIAIAATANGASGANGTANVSANVSASLGGGGGAVVVAPGSRISGVFGGAGLATDEVRASHELREEASAALLAASKEESSPGLTGWLAAPPTKTVAFLLQLENGGRMTRAYAATVLTALEAARSASPALVRAWREQMVQVQGPAAAAAAEGALWLARNAERLRGGMAPKAAARGDVESSGGWSGRGRGGGGDVESSGDEGDDAGGRPSAKRPRRAAAGGGRGGCGDGGSPSSASGGGTSSAAGGGTSSAPLVVSAKQVAIEQMQQDGKGFSMLPFKMRNDQDVTLAAVTSHGMALVFASDDLQATPDIVLAAVTSEYSGLGMEYYGRASEYHGLALEYASTKLRNDAAILSCLPKHMYDRLQKRKRELLRTLRAGILVRIFVLRLHKRRELRLQLEFDNDWAAAQDDPAVSGNTALMAVFHLAWEKGRLRGIKRARPTSHDDGDEDDDEYNDDSWSGRSGSPTSP